MQHDILAHDNADIKRIERKAYFGGRTECFRLGPIDQTVYQLDVNALFPAVMRDCLYPWKLSRYDLRADYLDLQSDIDYGNSVAEVIIETKHSLFPVRLPGRIAYPVGTFKTTLCGAELQHAKRFGLIRAVKSWAEYETADLFSFWVNELWGLRQKYKAENNRLYADFCKIMMNSLYGKFAQLSAEWINDPTAIPGLPWSQWSDIDMTTGKRTEYRSFGWLTQRMAPKRTELYGGFDAEGNPLPEGEIQWNEMGGTFVAISAFVGAAARIKMNGLRHTAGKGNVYYQGVDGLIVTAAGVKGLKEHGDITENELGKLRLQLAVDNGEIYGCSDYILGDKIVVSGRAKSAIDAETGQLMQRKFAGSDMLFCGTCSNTIEETLQPWERVGTYNKGVRQPDGWVEPLELTI